MDLFDVIISPKALSQLSSYIDYLQYTLLNDQAAQNVWQDAMDTREQLQTVAKSLKPCTEPIKAIRKTGAQSCFSFLFFCHTTKTLIKDKRALETECGQIQKNGIFFLCWVFTLTAIGAQAYVVRTAFYSGESLKSKFYGFPIAKIGAMYLAVKMTMCVGDFFFTKTLQFRDNGFDICALKYTHNQNAVIMKKI